MRQKKCISCFSLREVMTRQQKSAGPSFHTQNRKLSQTFSLGKCSTLSIHSKAKQANEQAVLLTIS